MSFPSPHFAKLYQYLPFSSALPSSILIIYGSLISIPSMVVYVILTLKKHGNKTVF